MVGTNDDYIDSNPDAYRLEMDSMGIKRKARLYIPLSSHGSTYLRTVAEHLHELANKLDDISHWDVQERVRLREAGAEVTRYNRLMNEPPALDEPMEDNVREFGGPLGGREGRKFGRGRRR